MTLRALVLAAVALALLPASALAAAPAPTGAYDFNGTLGPSSGWGGTAGYYHHPTHEATFEDATIPGAPRTPWTVLRIAPGASLTASPLADDFWAEDAPHPSWTVAFLVRLDAVTGPYDLLRVGGDPGLVIGVHNGHLRHGGTTGTATLSAGTWHQIVVTRDDVTDAVTAYVGGDEDLTFSDPTAVGEYRDAFTLFGDPDSVATHSGHVARLRGWTRPLGAADVAALDELDGTPPTIGLISPGEGANAGLRPQFHGSLLADDGSSKWNMLTTITLRDPDGDVAAVYPKAVPRRYGPAQDWVREWPQGATPLERGVRYTAEIVATDGAGNEATLLREFVADDPPPQMVIHEPGAETDDTTPHLEGWTSRWEGDVPWVHANLTVPEGQGSRGVSSVLMELAPDGSFSGDLQEVPPGDYTLRVTHADMGVRGVVHEQPLRVLAPPRAPEKAPAPQAEKEQPPPPKGDIDAGALRRSLLAALKRMPASKFARGGARVQFAATSPGAASVSVLLGRRVVASGRRTIARAGKATVTVKPTRVGRKALRKARRAKLTLRSTYRPRGGRAATVTASVTLRR